MLRTLLRQNRQNLVPNLLGRRWGGEKAVPRPPPGAYLEKLVEAFAQHVSHAFCEPETVCYGSIQVTHMTTFF